MAAEPVVMTTDPSDTLSDERLRHKENERLCYSLDPEYLKEQSCQVYGSMT